LDVDFPIETGGTFPHFHQHFSQMGSNHNILGKIGFGKGVSVPRIASVGDVFDHLWVCILWFIEFVLGEISHDSLLFVFAF